MANSSDDKRGNQALNFIKEYQLKKMSDEDLQELLEIQKLQSTLQKYPFPLSLFYCTIFRTIFFDEKNCVITIRMQTRSLEP